MKMTLDELSEEISQHYNHIVALQEKAKSLEKLRKALNTVADTIQEIIIATKNNGD